MKYFYVKYKISRLEVFKFFLWSHLMFKNINEEVCYGNLSAGGNDFCSPNDKLVTWHIYVLCKTVYCTCPGWLWWRIWWNKDWQGKLTYSEKTWVSVTLSTTNPTWPNTSANPGRCGGKPATNRFSYSAANRGENMYLNVWSTMRCYK
jgi:hypothetical protein